MKNIKQMERGVAEEQRRAKKSKGMKLL